ncbi:MAG: hypothetical protein ACKO5M_02625 [Vulcanococcus sp.]
MTLRQSIASSARPCLSQLQALRSPVLRMLLLASAAAVMPLLALRPAAANMMDQIILGKCSQAMKDDFTKAGKTPPAGMVDSTCSCVVAQMKKRQSIDQAKTTCTNQALQQYGKI